VEIECDVEGRCRAVIGDEREGVSTACLLTVLERVIDRGGAVALVGPAQLIVEPGMCVLKRLERPLEMNPGIGALTRQTRGGHQPGRQSHADNRAEKTPEPHKVILRQAVCRRKSLSAPLRESGQ
jgi:hypothetical protein